MDTTDAARAAQIYNAMVQAATALVLAADTLMADTSSTDRACLADLLPADQQQTFHGLETSIICRLDGFATANMPLDEWPTPDWWW
jgi:hypothetical protein